MHRLVHRTQVRTAAPEALGPGGAIGPLLRRLTAPLTRIGWLSIVGAAAYLVVWAWPWAMGGVPIETSDLTALVTLRLLASIATILLPAALEFGYPAVARRNPLLLRGVALLALSQGAMPLIGLVRAWASSTLFPMPDTGSVDLRLVFGQALTVARVLILVLGWTAILGGLIAAGARPRRGLAGAAILAVVGVALAADLRFLDQLWMSDYVLASVLNVLAIIIGLAESAILAAGFVALLTGAVRQLRPLLGWSLGVAAGLAVAGALVANVLSMLVLSSIQPGGTPDYTLFNVANVLNSASMPLLLLACLAGIGRGTDERRVARARRRAYVVSGDRRLRLAGG
ncbi:MAG: hypothetical protein ACYDAN_11660 [Candidatus Limnocylindrales bacterium]